MITHIWSVLCQGSSIDNESNSLSLFNVLDSVKVPKAINDEKDPTLALPFTIVSLWTRGDKNISVKGEARIRLKSPSGEMPPIVQMEIDLSTKPFYRTRVISHGLKWCGEGQYLFMVDYKDDDQAEWTTIAQLPLWMIVE